MTERIYYHDAYATTFDATVVEVRPRGERQMIVLDRTAFYPSSGGQPCDAGHLAGRAVLDVVDEPDGCVGHVLEGDATAGVEVSGRVDWQRRFDHMQQHTGQHILSAAFVQALDAPTSSFHLGERYATIDLDRSVTLEQARTAEDQANVVVWDDRAVRVRFATAEEAAGMPLRKESSREGRLRLIDIEAFDLSACGGTHVSRTGEVGLVAIVAVERHKGGSRVSFACGRRALAELRLVSDATRQSAALLSALPSEVPAAIARLQTDAKAAAKAARSAQGQLARYEGRELAGRAVALPSCRAVLATIADADGARLKGVARAVTCGDDLVAVLVSESTPALVAVAVAASLDVDATRIVGALTDAFGGRGGGSRALAQAGGLEATPGTILAAARHALEDAPS